MTALARRLEQRGHEVVIFGIADNEAQIRAAGVEFHLSASRTIRRVPSKNWMSGWAR
jgi:UDP:flavonoid glycosyltransferase YjiC (YdhE family)